MAFDYLFADFEKKTEKWQKISTLGTMSFPSRTDKGVVFRVVSAGSDSDVEIHRKFTPSYGSNLYKGFESIEVELDVHGATLIGGDASAFGFDVGGWRYVSLSDYIVQGFDGWQTITIPIADLVTAGLSVDAIASFLLLRIWHNNVVTVDISKITFKNHSSPYKFTQPDLPAKTASSNWEIESVDTMKWSKDTMRGQKTSAQIEALIAKDAELGVNYICVDCPYDSYDEYSPVIVDGYKQKFINAIRSHGVGVWHRQHFNAWEGDYDFPKITPRTTPSIALGNSIEDVLAGTDTTSWLALHYQYIIDHPTEFAAGDIFTPLCEIENGGIAGGTNDQFSNHQEMWEFMRNLHTLSWEAFKAIGLENKILIGLWGNSGYTALNRLDEFTVDCMGILSIDHYIFDPVQMNTDLDLTIDYYQVPVVIGEWGNTEEADEELNAANVIDIGNVFISKGSDIVGSNYWCDIGGSYESLLYDNITPKPNYYALQSLFGGVSWGSVGTLILPAPSSFAEQNVVTGDMRRTLRGTTKRAIKSLKKVWTLNYDMLSVSQYNAILTEFIKKNPSGGTFSGLAPLFTVSDSRLGIRKIPVAITLSERNIKPGTNYLSDLKITLTQL